MKYKITKWDIEEWLRFSLVKWEENQPKQKMSVSSMAAFVITGWGQEVVSRIKQHGGVDALKDCGRN